MIKAVIFDLDGLLVDSQHLQYKALSKAFSEKGVLLTEKDWYGWVHGSMNSKQWIELNNLSIDVGEIRVRKTEVLNHLLATRLKLKPGARKLINLLYNKFDLSVASSSRMESIEVCVDKFNLRSKFKYLISDIDLGKSKPHPAVFLHAAKIMKAKPEECLVFEDSLIGLQAAKSAGMKCIICPDNTMFEVPHDSYIGADKIVNSLNEVNLKMINELN